ncbi:MAG: hypothetical protein KKC68_09215 [Candidatus Thermoplasmatota archaeon]|nr:hypothetical protein [Candidatus Thermoplasmatota archaeon]
MKRYIPCLTLGVISLLLMLTVSPVMGIRPLQQITAQQEERAVEKIMDLIEDAASRATTFEEFINFLRNLLNRDEFKAFPIIRQILEKLMDTTIGKTGFTVRGNSITGVRDWNFFPNRSKKYFVISYGTYNRLNPWKDNQLTLSKEGLTFWRYGGTESLFKGRTLIIERQPFGIKQRVIGSHMGLMTGFRGLFFDMESRITGNSYTMFMGRAQRIRAFDLTPFSD